MVKVERLTADVEYVEEWIEEVVDEKEELI